MGTLRGLCAMIAICALVGCGAFQRQNDLPSDRFPNESVRSSAAAIDLSNVKYIEATFYGPAPRYRLERAVVKDKALIQETLNALRSSNRSSKVNENFMLAEAKYEGVSFEFLKGEQVGFVYSLHEAEAQHGVDFSKVVKKLEVLPRSR
jgi:hypothetical protein